MRERQLCSSTAVLRDQKQCADRLRWERSHCMLSSSSSSRDRACWR
jgi:hypothetical protein